MKITYRKQIHKTKIDGKTVWRWQIMSCKSLIIGGLCATLEDARNDLAITAKLKGISI